MAGASAETLSRLTALHCQTLALFVPPAALPRRVLSTLFLFLLILLLPLVVLLLLTLTRLGLLTLL
jgi:hypothetical protein